jgi:hypothetical protein
MVKGTSRIRPGRADQQDVGLGKLDVIVLGLMMEALVVVVDRDREDLLGVVLPDEVVVENLADFLRFRNAVPRFSQRGLVLLLDDVLAQLDAFIADEHGRSGDELAHFRRSIARLVPQLGQSTSSQGVPAISAARIVGDHSMSRLAASCSFQRSTTPFASARAAACQSARRQNGLKVGRRRTSRRHRPATGRPMVRGTQVEARVCRSRGCSRLRRRASIGTRAERRPSAWHQGEGGTPRVGKRVRSPPKRAPVIAM